MKSKIMYTISLGMFVQYSVKPTTSQLGNIILKTYFSKYLP